MTQSSDHTGDTRDIEPSEGDEAEYQDEFDESEPTGPAFEVGPDSLGGSSRTRPRDEALDGSLPLLMLHREARYFSQLSDSVRAMHATNAASLSLGVVVNLPRLKPDVAQTWLSSPRGASVLIADPEAYCRDDMWGRMLITEKDGPEPARALMPQTAGLWDYWNRELPDGPNEGWVDEVLDAQRGAGANLLLTPGTPLDEHNPAPSLQRLEQEIAWARTRVGADERLAVNITMDSAWLSSSALRARLLNEMVESDEDTWYVRVKWPTAPGFSQLVEASVLDGYRELSAIMEDEGRVLLLPNTGGTGWVSLAWGATGYGTGIGNAARGFTTQRPIRRKNPTQPPPRYYERALLHTVEKTTSDALARIPGYTPCTCGYCAQLRASQTWDAALAGQHYLLATAAQTAALAGGAGRRGVARRIVRTARRTRDHVVGTVPLTDRDAPAHLPLWVDRLL